MFTSGLILDGPRNVEWLDLKLFSAWEFRLMRERIPPPHVQLQLVFQIKMFCRLFYGYAKNRLKIYTYVVSIINLRIYISFTVHIWHTYADHYIYIYNKCQSFNHVAFLKSWVLTFHQFNMPFQDPRTNAQVLGAQVPGVSKPSVTGMLKGWEFKELGRLMMGMMWKFRGYWRVFSV